MPPTTRSNGKPPPSRIYNTTPTLHQVQFPARRKVVKTYSKKKGTPASKASSSRDADSTKPSSSKPTSSAATRSSKRLDPRQKTLTQIDWVSSSFSERPDVEFSDSEEEKENDDPDEEGNEDDEPVSSTKRKRPQAKGSKTKRRRTLGDPVNANNGRPAKGKGKSRRKTLGDAPSASAYHTQTLTQFVGRDAMKMMIGDSEDEDEGGLDDLLKEVDSPTLRAKNHAQKKSPGKAQAPTEANTDPSTPAKKKRHTDIWEVPSSSQSGTPLSNRMLSRYGAPDSNKATPSKGTQQEVITEAKGKTLSLVIQDSFGTASWESLSKATPSRKTPSKGTPLKDITEEMTVGNEETPTKKASLRASQRSKRSTKTGKENETPTKAAFQRHQSGTPTPQKKKSPKKLSSGKFEIPDSDEDEDGFTESEGEEIHRQVLVDEESQGEAQVEEETEDEDAAPVAAEESIILGDPSEIFDQDTYIENAKMDDDVDGTAPTPSQPREQFTHVNKTPRRGDADDVEFEMPESATTERSEQFTHLDKTPRGGHSVVDFGFTSSAPQSAKRDQEASYVDKTQHQDSFRTMLPPSSAVKSEQFTHLDKTQQDYHSVIDYGFQSSAPASSSRDGEASYVDKTQQQESIRTMLPPSSAVTTEQFTHLDKTQQEQEATINYDFEAFPPSAAPSTQEEEQPYTHIDKTQHEEITPRAHVRFRSTPAIIPSPVQPPPTASEDRVAATQETDETPFATAKEIADEPTASRASPEATAIDGETQDDYTGEETQFVWKEIESSKEDPFQSTTSSRQRTSSVETPHTSPQLPTPKASKHKQQKPLRKPLRHLPPSSQTETLESQRLPLSIIQAMGERQPHTDIILPVPSSSLAPLVSGHSLHLSLPFKIPPQVVRFWLFENREVVRYGVCAELEDEIVENGEKAWRYFIPQVFELNNPRDMEELSEEGFILKRVERYAYLDPAPVAQLLANLRHALFSIDGEDEAETQLTEIEEEDEDATQDRPVPEEPQRAIITPRKRTPNPGSSFSISQAVEAQLLSEQATNKSDSSTDEILCPSTPLKDQPSAPPPTNPIVGESATKPVTRSPFVRPSQATTASQASTPEREQSQYLPMASTPTRAQRRSQARRSMLPPPESSSGHLTFPESDSSPSFLIPLSQAAAGLRSSQLLTKSQMLPDSLVRDDGGWDTSG